MISRPKVIALINPNESTVDIIVANIPTINNPNMMGGRISIPSNGNANNGSEISRANLA